ncbi:TPA: hypothetical protein ACOEBP_004916 [Enterobacter ludwigii]
MKLPEESISTQEKLLEFDQWLTAKLDRIKDSEKFTSEIEALCQCIRHIAPFLNDFDTYEDANIENLCVAVMRSAESFLSGDSFLDDEDYICKFFDAFFNLLFLSTGATDNNLKNHFLIKLKIDGITPLFPKRAAGKRNVKFKLSTIPTTTKSDFIARLLASCYVACSKPYFDTVKTEPVFDIEIYLRVFLKAYIELILEDKEDLYQLWSVCRSYLELNKISKEADFGRYLLNSCTIFKVRGSVSASGGHAPEKILRNKLYDIGLRPDIDFNIADVNIGEQEVVEEGKRRKKTRAYDFIIPFRIPSWEPKAKLFIQSQFYAGDSGSVSHKVVDQTQSSRVFTLSKYPNARFVEYLDGAGYYASLRGDLEHMLSFNDTASFFQVKSILLRLRREFQVIKYLTPIEIEHSILTCTDRKIDTFKANLISDGYPDDEVNRAVSVSLDLGFIEINEGVVSISSKRLDISRRLLLLDIIAINSKKITDDERRSLKYLLVPGYGENMGMLESDLSKTVSDIMTYQQITLTQFTTDLEWLLDEKVVKRN